MNSIYSGKMALRIYNFSHNLALNSSFFMMTTKLNPFSHNLALNSSFFMMTTKLNPFSHMPYTV